MVRNLRVLSYEVLNKKERYQNFGALRYVGTFAWKRSVTCDNSLLLRAKTSLHIN